MKNPFKELNKLEILIWLFSVTVVTVAFIISPEKDYLTLISSLVGVTSLIFIAKGMIFGHIVSAVFSVFYFIVSYFNKYYGEAIICLFMIPLTIGTTVAWLKHPYKQTEEVTVSKLSAGKLIAVLCSGVLVAVGFYFILRALNTSSLIVSTISVATSFTACALNLLRSPYYAIAFILNDVILIILWVTATLEVTSYLPMIMCFSMFLLNDAYAFINWKIMQKRQTDEK